MSSIRAICNFSTRQPSLKFDRGLQWHRLATSVPAVYAIPYLAIFSNIISDPRSPDCFKDLQLLRQVVIYFLQMHNNHPSAKKLEKVAETFTRLTKAYVRHSMVTPHADINTSHPVFPPSSDQTSASRPENMGAAAGFSTPIYPSTHDGHGDTASEISSMPPLTDWSDPSTAFNFDDLDSDTLTLLNFFSAPGMEGASTDNFLANPGQQEPTNEFENENAIPSSTPLFQGLENIAQNYGLDCNFDWFSWDQYDSAMS
jgi:hypothetical protein